MEDSTLTWKIENFSVLTAEMEKLKSDTYILYGHEWNIWLHSKSPRGSHLSLFLSVANPKSLPASCNIFADFCIAVLNQLDDTQTLRNYSTSECYFDDPATKWGWDEFVPLSKLKDTPGFLVDDTLIVKAQIALKPNLSPPITSKTPVHDFAALFDDIHKVVAASPSSAASSQGTHSGHQTPEISLSLSLLKHETDRSFSDVHSRIGTELCSALKHLAQARSVPQAQASALADFSSQFTELCQSYASNIAVMDASQLFFESKDDTFSSLKRMNNAHVKIKKSIDEVTKEIEQLERRMRRLKDSKSRLLQEYATIGKKSERLKAEWDEITAKNEDVTEQKERAEKEVAEIETKWTNFISLFK